jgi:hypothetical protein
MFRCAADLQSTAKIRPVAAGRKERPSTSKEATAIADKKPYLAHVMDSYAQRPRAEIVARPDAAFNLGDFPTE